MIETPTVLVLGAGASAHCGYPMGSQLRDGVCRLRGAPELESLPGPWSKLEAESFIDQLRGAAYGSVDAFLERNTKYVDLGKYLIARELKRRENLDALFPPYKPGWYEYLLQCLVPDEVAEFENGALGIITFNYDRSLEAYLHNGLKARCKLADADAEHELRALRIVHVHGTLGDYPSVRYQPECTADELLAMSKSIQIVHELEDREGDFCNEMFRTAHAMLSAAKRIYFLGFGFNPNNLKRFRFFDGEQTTGKEMRSTTHGMLHVECERRAAQFSHSGFTRDCFDTSTGDCMRFFRNYPLD
jgi:hypothetical protein